MSATVMHLPRPQTHDPEAIFRGRQRALEQYQNAKTDKDRLRALVWVNHWRVLAAHAKALESLRA